MSDTVAVESVAASRKRLRRTPEEKRRIVEATFVPGASIARVAREHGVNANQVFQWRYEYRKGTLGVRQQTQSKLLPVTVTAEPNSVTLSGILDCPYLQIICVRTCQLRQLSAVRAAHTLAMCGSRCMIFANCDAKTKLFDEAQYTG